MKSKIVILLLLALLLSVSVVEAGDWQSKIVSDTRTWCIIGEKSDASDGVDQYDAPHPPFFPPGRCFLYLSEPGFPAPYYNLIMEFKQHEGSKVFNLSCFWFPMWSGGAWVTLVWKPESFARSGYDSVVLSPVGVDMLLKSQFRFWSGAYETRTFQIVCQEPTCL